MNYLVTGIDMKKMGKILFLVFIFHSCGVKKEYARMLLINDSAHDIVIHGYDKGRKRLERTISLHSGASFKSERAVTNGSGDDGPIPLFVFEGDSVVVTFSDLKRQIFYYPLRDPDHVLFKYDLLVIDNYNKKSGKKEDIYMYTFTNEQYEDAVEID